MSLWNVLSSAEPVHQPYIVLGIRYIWRGRQDVVNLLECEQNVVPMFLDWALAHSCMSQIANLKNFPMHFYIVLCPSQAPFTIRLTMAISHLSLVRVITKVCSRHEVSTWVLVCVYIHMYMSQTCTRSVVWWSCGHNEMPLSFIIVLLASRLLL